MVNNMKITEIIKAERDKNRDNNIARLYLDGDWYRAYEKSAYLIRNYPNTLSETDKLKPTQRFYKELKESIISVGLKLTSINKFMPNCEYKIEDGYIDVNIPSNLFCEDDFSEELNKWKESVPQKKVKNKGSVYSKPFSMTDIFKEIMSYRIEDASLEDNREFLYMLKDKCYTIFG